MENQPVEKQTPFLKRVAKMEQEIAEISKQLDTLKKAFRNIGR